jgi:formylglycine-generating enzyme required for sulfatase activity
MNRPHRSIEIFTMSALDLFITAMGSFAILMMILFPYFKGRKKIEELKVLNTPGNVLFSIWPTRLSDFEEFVKSVPDMKERGEENRPTFFVDDNVWKNPGYEQSPEHPVVGVTWLQATAFCRWLTKKERAAGIIQPDSFYRLPTDAEWRAGAGPGDYPWGNAWPPPENVGNFAGEEWAREAGHPEALGDLKGYTDKHTMVAPVASYPPNRFGLYDMAGNVRQWIGDTYRPDMATEAQRKKYPSLNRALDGKGQVGYVLRGSSWQEYRQDNLRSDDFIQRDPTFHPDTGGFRVVLEIPSKPPGKPAR